MSRMHALRASVPETMERWTKEAACAVEIPLKR